MTITDCCPSNKTDGATDSDGAADTAAGEEKASCLGFGLDKKSDDSQENILGLDKKSDDSPQKKPG